MEDLGRCPCFGYYYKPHFGGLRHQLCRRQCQTPNNTPGRIGSDELLCRRILFETNHDSAQGTQEARAFDTYNLGPKRCSRELLDVIRLHESLQFVEIHHQPGNKYKLDFNDFEHFAHLHTIINENETRSRVPGGDATNTDQM
jgi:hypothetical protein